MQFSFDKESEHTDYFARITKNVISFINNKFAMGDFQRQNLVIVLVLVAKLPKLPCMDQVFGDRSLISTGLQCRILKWNVVTTCLPQSRLILSLKSIFLMQKTADYHCQSRPATKYDK